MPIFAALFVKTLGGVYALMLAMFGAKWAVRITAAATIAGLYIGCAVTFTAMIGPWLIMFAGTQLGMVLGLLFPPMAGTALASLGTFWACILAKRHTVRLIKMTVS